jgi:hypothetical protein
MRLFLETILGDYSWRLFLETILGDYAWRLFLETMLEIDNLRPRRRNRAPVWAWSPGIGDL